MRPSAALALRFSRALAMRPTQGQLLRQSGRRHMPQDMPPEGGYDPVQYKRNLPTKGFRPVYYVAIVAAITTYGFYKLYIGVNEWNELARERMWARIHLIPLLQAEEDRDQVRRYYANEEREKELLGAATKVYHTDRFVRPTYSAGPPETKK